MSCRLNGACELRAELARRFAGARVEDVQIKDVSCLGRCDRAPAVAVNDAIFEGVSAEQVEQLARRAMRGEELHAEHPEVARVTCASDPYGESEKYVAVRRLVGTRDYDGVLSTLKEAELRGMGGAGFPDFDEMGSGAETGGTGEVRGLQCGRERAGNDQGPLHSEPSAAPGGGRNDDRGTGDGREKAEFCISGTNTRCRKRFLQRSCGGA